MDKQCPYCAETIKAAAIRCRYCHADLTSTMPAASAVLPGVPAPAATPANAAATPGVPKKSAAMGYLWFFLLGSFGAHRFYFQREVGAMCQAGLTIVSLVLLAIIPDGADSGTYASVLLLYGALMVWMVIDLFLIPSWAREFNAAQLQPVAVVGVPQPQNPAAG